MKSVQANCPDARIAGVTVQRMIESKNGFELILGTKKDPIFGTVILVGTGGITAELLKDRALGFPPLNERLARRMLESLKIYPLFKGYRGNPPIDADRVIEIMIRLSYLVTDYPQIKELDVNPLLAMPGDAIALDARIISDLTLSNRDYGTYNHLALRPYPEEYVSEKILEDGTRIVLRPIKPEDEPMWMSLLGSCSRESIYMRFRYFFNWATHDVAVRYCFIDYDREIAIVAELNDGESRKLLGVGRLVGDPDHENVEYAVLISDAWQNRGLGSIITDACFEIAKRWGLKRIVAQTTTDNPRMIEVFRKRDFQISIDSSSSLVEVSKDLF
jgi:acetyltransferase